MNPDEKAFRVKYPCWWSNIGPENLTVFVENNTPKG